MAEPLRDAEVDEVTEWLVHTPDGRTFRDVDVSVTEEQYKLLWNGRMCAWCFQPWEEQWPKKCTLVGCWSPDKMTESAQRKYLGERFGYRWFGPSQETVDRWENEQDRAGWKSNKASSIWVPGSVE